jgi:hypothetical protein
VGAGRGGGRGGGEPREAGGRPGEGGVPAWARGEAAGVAAVRQREKRKEKERRRKKKAGRAAG